MQIREAIIRNYIEGYNNFDINKMIIDFDKNVEFKNISNGETNFALKGLSAFIEQAEQAKNYFSVRKQSIMAFRHQHDETEIEIDYYAVLAMDFPNGLKKGEELKLKGTSIFKFSANKIIELTDVS